jgi:hypothetical protein
MSNETIFSIASGIALISWLILIIFAYKPWVAKILLGVPIALLCVTYLLLVFQTLQPADFEKFNTLAGVTSLMSVPGAALVGWIHYLAFDLMTGLYIATNASKLGIRQLLIIPCLLATFMLGPVGLLLYLLIRWAHTQHWFSYNE